MYTIKDIIELDPCEEYTREKLEELWKGKESLTLREILELDIDIKDRNWVVAQLVSTEIVIKWAHLCAHEAKKHADNAAATADKSAADRVAWYAASVAISTADAARSARDAARSDRYAAHYANEAARSAGYAARSAASAFAASAFAARSAARSAADAGSTAGSAWSKNRGKELYRLLTILCNMEEESK